MRCMERNKVPFWFARYAGKKPIQDEYGNETGEYEVLRENPVRAFGNISAARGETETRQFGEAEGYDKVLVVDNFAPALDEYTVLWVDDVPEVDGGGALAVNSRGEVKTPHDYIIRKVARSLNSVSYAISKVNVR